MLDDAIWPDTSSLIDEACGSKGNFLTCSGANSSKDIEIFFTRFCYRGERNPEFEREYFEDYHPVDERPPRIRQLAIEQVVHVDSLYTDEEKKTSVIYNKVLPTFSSQDSLNVRLDGPDGTQIVWGVIDPIDGEGWSANRVDTIQRLLPHLRQFVRVRQTLANAHALGSSVTALIENSRCAVFHLDYRGRIVAASDLAQTILRNREGLVDRDDQLRAVIAKEDDALQALLSRVLPPYGGQGESGSITLSGNDCSPPLVVHVCPAGNGLHNVRPNHVAALVLVVDLKNQTPIDTDLVSTILGLTPAESHAAVLLAQGLSIRDIALATGRSEGTVRWHSKQIFRKLGVSRQAEVVQLVMSLSRIPQ